MHFGSYWLFIAHARRLNLSRKSIEEVACDITDNVVKAMPRRSRPLAKILVILGIQQGIDHKSGEGDRCFCGFLFRSTPACGYSML